VDQNVFDWASKATLKTAVTPELIVRAARELFASTEDAEERALAATLDVRHVIVDIGSLHYGMQDRNPIDFVKFYSKEHPNGKYSARFPYWSNWYRSIAECSHIRTGEFATLLPASFGEIHLRIYTRDARFRALIQAGYREVIRALPSYVPLGGTDDDDVDALEVDEVDATVLLPSGALTPPASTAPTTPRMSARSLASLADGSAATITTTPGSAGTPVRSLGREGSVKRTTPFTENHFLTMPRAAPASPTRAQAVGTPPGKRLRPREEGEGEPMKRARNAWGCG
jgi:deoxynucleoside triphosphate triphosphohydrolase SAMHD1